MALTQQEAIETLAQILGPALAGVSLQDAPVHVAGMGIVEFAEKFFYIPETEQPIELLPHQKSILEYALETHNFSTIIYSTVKKSGKALSIHTLIPTPDGFTTMEELEVGDRVFDKGGKVCKVSFATEVMLGHRCYKVSFSDDSFVVADAEHLWEVSALDNHYRVEILTTEQMLPRLYRNDGARNFRIPCTMPLDLPDREFTIPPYILGVWLGDGSKRDGQITCSEDEILSQIEFEGESVSRRPDYGLNKAPQYYISPHPGGGSIEARSYTLTARLRHLNVLNNKHIPDSYLRGSFGQRLDLLQGLMDTDGYVSPGGECCFEQTNESLCAGAFELVASLGLKPTLTIGTSSLYGVDCGPKFRLKFFAPKDMPISRLERKHSCQKEFISRGLNRHITNIEPVDSVPVRCIQVDSPTHTYLFGESMIPTHNTAMASLVARWISECWPRAEVLLFANDLEQAKGRVYAKAIESIELTPGYDSARRELPGKWKIVDRQASYLPSKGLMRAVSSDYRGEAGANPSATFWSELWAYECLCQDTQIMTRQGWKTYTDLTLDTEVATLSADGFMEWQKPNNINIQSYDGNLIRFKHRRCDMLITPNHRVLARYSKNQDNGIATLTKRLKEGGQIIGEGNWFEYAINAREYQKGWIAATADWGAPDRDTFTVGDHTYSFDDWSSFMGWYISEGSLQKGFKGRPYGIQISQDLKYNTDNYSKIMDLLERMGLSFKASKVGFLIYDIKLGNYLKQFGLSADKYIPEEIKSASKRQIRLFFDAYISGDGWIAGRGYQCCTKSDKLVDDLCEIAIKIGFIPSIIEEADDINRLGFRTGAIAWEKSGNHWSEEYYKGTVWCVTVPNSTIYVKRAGTCYWTGNSEASRRLWDELTPVPTRRSIRYVETYAGFEDQPGPLLDLYRLGRAGRRLTHEEIFWPFPDQPPIWINPVANMFMYWDEGEIARRMPWQTPEYYSSQAATLRPLAFDRLHKNIWTGSTSAFIPIEWWDSCYDKEFPELDKTVPVVIGVDASVSSDCTALVGVSRDPRDKTNVLIRFSQIWTPPLGGYINLADLDSALRRLCTQYNVAQITYDAYQLHKLMTDLTHDGIVWCKAFSQADSRMKADKQLYDMIRDRRIHHREGSEAREHILHCAAQQSKHEDTRLRIVKKSPSEKIDYAVALSQATSECLRLML